MAKSNRRRRRYRRQTVRVLVDYHSEHGARCDYATTLGAGCFLWMCTLTFFTKFAILIIGTIGFSLAAALLFFMPLVATLGPEGDTCDVVALAKKAAGGAKREP